VEEDEEKISEALFMRSSTPRSLLHALFSDPSCLSPLKRNASIYPLFLSLSLEKVGEEVRRREEEMRKKIEEREEKRRKVMEEAKEERKRGEEKSKIIE
jgi:hypothetical protein